MSSYSLYSGDTGEEDDRDKTFRALIDSMATPDEAPSPPTAAAPIDDVPEPPKTRVEATGRAAQADDPLKAAFEQRLMQQMTADSGPQKPATRQMASGPDVGVGLAPAAAIVLDMFVNKGRGAGQIVGATANSIDADRRAEQQRLDRLAEIESRHSSNKDPLTAYLALRNVNARDFEDQNVKMGNLSVRQQQEAAKDDPTSAAAQGRVKTTYNNSYARREGMNDQNADAAPVINQNAADKAKLVRGAVDAQAHEDAPVKSQDKAADIEITTPAAASRAGAIAEAQLPAKEKAQQNQHDLTAGGSRPVFPDSELTDPEAWGALDRSTYGKEKASHEADMQQDQALEKMKDVRKRGGMQPFSSQDKSEYQAAYAQLQGAQAKKAALGTLQEGERKILEGIDPTLDPHLSDAKDWVLDQFANGSKHDTVLEQLTGLQKQGRDSAEVRARISGYRPRWGAAPAAPAPAIVSDVSDTPDTLPVAGRGRVSDTPDLPADAKKGGGARYRITTPTGQTGETEMPPELAEKLKRKHFKVEAL